MNILSKFWQQYLKWVMTHWVLVKKSCMSPDDLKNRVLQLPKWSRETYHQCLRNHYLLLASLNTPLLFQLFLLHVHHELKFAFFYFCFCLGMVPEAFLLVCCCSAFSLTWWTNLATIIKSLNLAFTLTTKFSQHYCQDFHRKLTPF